MDNKINPCSMGSMARLNAPSPASSKKEVAEPKDVFKAPAAGDQVQIGNGFGVSAAENMGRAQVAFGNLDISKLNPDLVASLSSGMIPMDKDVMTQSVKNEFGGISDSTAGKIADMAMSKLLASKSDKSSA